MRPPTTALRAAATGGLILVASLLVIAPRGHAQPARDAQSNYVEATRHRQLDQPDKEIAALRQAVELDPKHFEAHRALGDALTRKGDIKGALRAYEAALASAPKTDAVRAQIHFSIGMTHLERGDDEAAHEAFRSTLEVAPDHVRAMYKIGNIHRRAGELDKAIARYREAAAGSHEYSWSAEQHLAEALNAKAAGLEKAGEKDEALALYKEVMTLQTEGQSAHLTASKGIERITGEPFVPTMDDAKGEPLSDRPANRVVFPKATVLRASADGEGRVVAKLPESSGGTVLGERGGWLQVRYDGKTGWVEARRAERDVAAYVDKTWKTFLEDNDAIPDDDEEFGLKDDLIIAQAVLEKNEKALRPFADACGYTWSRLTA